MTSTLRLSIVDIASTGDGIAKHNGKVYFVKGAYPHQTVNAHIIQEKSRYTLCTTLDIIEDTLPSRPYLCPHTTCGGCALRLLPYEEQCAYKERILSNAFTKIAKIPFPTCNILHAMQEPRRYRSRVDFHYGYTHDGTCDIGFYEAHSHTIVPITHCALITDEMHTILHIARRQLALSSAPVYHNKQGFWRHLSIRHAVHHNSYLVHCITSPESIYYTDVEYLFSAIQEYLPSCICVHSVRKSTVSIAQGEHYVTNPQEAFLTEQITIGNHICSLQYGANSFFQNNYTMMLSLYTAIAEQCQEAGRYADICTGVGSIALSCFTKATNIYGIDYVGEAISYAQKNAIHTTTPIYFQAMDMQYIKEKHICNVDVVCVDPPRGGLHRAVINALLHSHVHKILYVSCNPSTMARDCSILHKAYKILHSTPFDMFPHTVHCESLTVLERR